MSTPPAPTRLYLLRHGEVATRYHHTFGGTIDMDLSELGHEHARRLADYLRRFEIDAVYGSPMQRARQTLEPYRQCFAGEPVFLDDLREIDFGSWTGLRWHEVEEKFGVSPFNWLDILEAGAMDGAESLRAFSDRVRTALEHILAEHAGQGVAVFCHGGVVRMLLSLILDLPMRLTGRMQIEYGSLSLVRHRPDRAELQLLNFTPWRDA